MADIETINDMKDDERLEAADRSAARIADQIASTTDPSALRALAAAAQSLLSAVPLGANGSGSVISRIASVVAAATSKEAEESEIEDASGSSLGSGRGPMGRMSQEFQKAIYNQFMSTEEKAYYDQFQSGTQYKMASIDENGNITEKMVDGKQATVDGTQLKEDFARVKSYTLTEEEQAKLTTPDGQKMAAMPPAEEKKELDKLEKSLENLEGQKAQELAVTGAPQEEAKRVRDRFEGARRRVRELRDSLDRVGDEIAAERPNAEAQARDDVRLKRGRLRETLQEDVIDDALLDKKREGRSRRGRGKDDDLESAMVTPAGSRTGGVHAETEEGKKAANGEIMASQDDGKSPEKTSQISGGKNVDAQDIAALSPAAAGSVVRSTSREMS